MHFSSALGMCRDLRTLDSDSYWAFLAVLAAESGKALFKRVRGDLVSYWGLAVRATLRVTVAKSLCKVGSVAGFRWVYINLLGILLMRVSSGCYCWLPAIQALLDGVKGMDHKDRPSAPQREREALSCPSCRLPQDGHQTCEPPRVA